MENELAFLLEDPRPDLPGDSGQWQQLFRLIPQLQDRKTAYTLSTSLWHLRAWGTMIRRDERYRIKLVPYIHPVEGWASEDEYKEVTSRHLTPYADAIRVVLSWLR